MYCEHAEGLGSRGQTGEAEARDEVDAPVADVDLKGRRHPGGADVVDGKLGVIDVVDLDVGAEFDRRADEVPGGIADRHVRIPERDGGDDDQLPLDVAVRAPEDVEPLVDDEDEATDRPAQDRRRLDVKVVREDEGQQASVLEVKREVGGVRGQPGPQAEPADQLRRRPDAASRSRRCARRRTTCRSAWRRRGSASVRRTAQ